MPAVVLCTFSARYIHSPFALMCLKANLDLPDSECKILEFDLKQSEVDAAEHILEHSPAIVGISVYCWNILVTRRLVRLLKHLSPATTIVLGGPEISYEYENDPAFLDCDHLVVGEGEIAFADLCRRILSGAWRRTGKGPGKVLFAPPPDLSRIQLPYHLYSDEDIAHRVIYVESSRGCPYSCAYCTSAISHTLRLFPLGKLSPCIEELVRRGASRLKFLDRSFNANAESATQLLDFIASLRVDNPEIHLEIMPVKLSTKFRESLMRFPAGCFHLEVGVQTFNENINREIGRIQPAKTCEETIRFLVDELQAAVHADLIVGLPEENEASFAESFDRLVDIGPSELQVNILKRLRGTPLAARPPGVETLFNPSPPYELLANPFYDFASIQRMKRFARFWHLLANRNLFNNTVTLLWRDGASAYSRVMYCSDHLFKLFGRAHAISRNKLARGLFDFLSINLNIDKSVIANAMFEDGLRDRRGRPVFFIRDFLQTT